MEQVAVLIPCLNEAMTIQKVIDDFRKALPGCEIYVGDNGSVDGSDKIAKLAGAKIIHEARRGKGFVVKRMFRDIDASTYILVDGDDTYDPETACKMVQMVQEGADLVNGVRVEDTSSNPYRAGHRFGNQLLTGIVKRLFGDEIEDMLSGYKGMSRRFIKSFPSFSEGFEVETEIVIHALEMGVTIGNVKGRYRSRPEGSFSKLHSLKDGRRILAQILILLKQEKPLLLFSSVSFILAVTSIVLGIPLILFYLKTGLVPRVPTAILSTGLMILAVLSFLVGLILDSISRSRKEVKILSFLSVDPSPQKNMSDKEN